MVRWRDGWSGGVVEKKKGVVERNACETCARLRKNGAN